MLNYSSSIFSIHVVYVVFLFRAKLQNTQSQLCKIMYNLLQWLNIYAMNPQPFSYMSLTLDWPLCIFTINEQISQPNFVNKILCICILCAWGFLFNSCKTLQICISNRLGAEVSTSDVNMHKGHNLLSILHRCLLFQPISLTCK